MFEKRISFFDSEGTWSPESKQMRADFFCFAMSDESPDRSQQNVFEPFLVRYAIKYVFLKKHFTNVLKIRILEGSYFHA